jgi:hypothetical protein
VEGAAHLTAASTGSLRAETAHIGSRACRSIAREGGVSFVRDHTERLAGAGLWRFALPLAAFAALDFACRLWLAWLLELLRPSAGLLQSLVACAIGVGVDLVFVLPAYALLAFTPCGATRALSCLVFTACLAVLGADAIYFFNTFEHVEPVLFNNINRSSVLGSVAGSVAIGAAVSALALAAVAWTHAFWARNAANGRQRGLALALAACAVASAALGSSDIRARMPKQDREAESYLNETRDAYLAKVSAPILAGFLGALRDRADLERPSESEAPLDYAADERALLEKLGLLRAAQAPPDRKPAFDRIVFLVFESMPAAYLHHYNPTIPAEATPFLDDLLRRHPHADRFFTTNMPTDHGLNSLFLSRLAPDWGGGRESLFSVLRREAGFESHFVRAVSKHYGNQLITYPRIFQFDHFVAAEELQSRYRSRWHSGWGENNATVYEEGLRILTEKIDRKLLLVLKTIDLHQPGPFQAIPRKHLPEGLQKRDVPVFNTLHWVDRCARAFFEDLEKRGLFSERTLVVVTSDHGPHPGAAYRDLVPHEEYRRLARLPLIFVARDNAALRDLDVDGFASQVDLAPTILDLLGIDVPPGFVGRSLLGRDPERFRLGLYRAEFSYASARTSFSETITGDGASGTLRGRAIRKWLHNQDAGKAVVLAHRSR